jgi:precorrin-2 dehydrogenase/sirohydrochlorin ferrochelatase
LLIDLKLDGKTVTVIGGGVEAHRKIQNFLDSGAKILVVSQGFSNGIQQLGKTKKVALLKTKIQNAKDFIESLNPKPHILLAATNDSKLNLELVEAAKAWGCTIYSVDNPALSDFRLPAVARVGDVKVAVSTGGKSPAVARALRQRIEKLVTPEDLLEIELQADMRRILKLSVSDSNQRRNLLYETLNNNDVKKALSEGNLQEAKELALKLIKKKEK